jgi:hypothetical protein
VEGYGRISLLLFLTHYILYLEIQTSDDVCITSCDNQSLLVNEEKFHTRDIDSSSWYTNLDHDVIMTLSALRTKLAFQLASLHVRGRQDKHCKFELLTRPQQIYVLADQLATEVLEDLRAADKPTELYPLPACRASLRDGTGHITSNEKRTLKNEFPEFPEYETRASLQQRNGWNAHTLDSINWTAYQAAISALTNQVPTPPLSSNSAMTGYLLAFGNTNTAPRMPPARNASNPKQYAGCASVTLEQIGETNSSLSSRNTSKTRSLQLTFDAPS